MERKVPLGKEGRTRKKFMGVRNRLAAEGPSSMPEP